MNPEQPNKKMRLRRQAYNDIWLELSELCPKLIQYRGITDAPLMYRCNWQAGTRRSFCQRIFTRLGMTLECQQAQIHSSHLTLCPQRLRESQ
jgi:hypothetical protein